ncbi:MAG: 4-alpha-glucanotransferase [Candidatus Eisenbacteria bacterium]
MHRIANRGSGILMHVTSLPGPGGIGTLGAEAVRFLDHLRDAGQTVWQVLPLGPTGYGDSPYQSFSAFAGNPLLVNGPRLLEEQLVEPGDLESLAEGDAGRVDFGAVILAKRALLAKAFESFRRGRGPAALVRAFSDFRETHAAWLEDFALFMAIHEARGASWVEWPEAERDHEEHALRAARLRHADDIVSGAFAQFLFFRQWESLRAEAAARGIQVLSDMPLFVAHDSCDVWAHRDLFDLDSAGMPRTLAGAPPDDFTADGQLWGNPLYVWDRLRERGFDWWIARVRSALALCDRVRLDHFRGFLACWASAAGETTARNGKWVPVPGGELFDRLRTEFESLPFLAEDLGDISPDVHELRDRLGLPGMKILQFGFGGDPRENEFAPHHFVRNAVVYTGTHDNETMRGWWENRSRAVGSRKQDAAQEQARILAITGTDGAEIHWDFVRLALASVADTAIVPMQDLLGLGNEARMNTPGNPAGNWVWRVAQGGWTDAIGERLLGLTRATGREPARIQALSDSPA